MGRSPRVDVAGYCYHVLNRSVGRRRLFHRDDDFEAFERVLGEATTRTAGDVALLAYAVLSNHWHLVVRTHADGALSPFMKWLTLTHTQRYRVAHGNVGDGPVYQGRYKSSLVADDEHLLTVCRYVERNPLRAGLVKRAEAWRFGSLWRWRNAADDEALPLSQWPVPTGRADASDGSGRPRQWLRTVNAPLSASDRDAVRVAVQRCRPIGSDDWVARMCKRYDLSSTLRPPGRPKLEA